MNDAAEDAPTEPPRPPCADWLTHQIRDLAETLGALVRDRALPRAEMKAARGLLRRAFAFETADTFDLGVGRALLNDLEVAMGEGLSEQERLHLAWDHFHRLMRRWPATVPCLHRVPVTRAAYVALDMVDERLDRLDRVFELLQVDDELAWHEVRDRKMGPFDGPSREIVKKEGSE